VRLRGISQSESIVEICEQVMAGPSYFPWNGSSCSVHDMELPSQHLHSPIFTLIPPSQKSSKTVITPGARLSDHHTFLPYTDLNSIIAAYAELHTGQAGIKQE